MSNNLGPDSIPREKTPQVYHNKPILLGQTQMPQLAMTACLQGQAGGTATTPKRIHLLRDTLPALQVTNTMRWLAFTQTRPRAQRRNSEFHQKTMIMSLYVDMCAWAHVTCAGVLTQSYGDDMVPFLYSLAQVFVCARV